MVSLSLDTTLQSTTMSGPNREILLNCLTIVADFHQNYPLPDTVLRYVLALVSKLGKLDWLHPHSHAEDGSHKILLAKPVCFFYKESLR